MTGDQAAEALRATLENAVRAPYYARTIGDRWRSVVSVDDLAQLPLLDKATAIQHQHELIVGAPPPGFGIASSGTTRHRDLPALNVLRSREELEAIRGAPLDATIAADDPDDPHPGWTLIAVGVHHGLPLDPPALDEIRVPWTYHRNSLSMIDTVLAQTQPDGQRVTAMRISAGALKTFTAWVLERQIDPTRYAVKMIGTNGSRLSTFWRERIGALFGAELYDNYSLSELPTAATECKSCGALHFGWPPMFWEVLDLATGRPSENGPGRLVLTSVFPYVEKMPLIRYDTGDVVSIASTCRATGGEGIVFLGRARRGIVIERDGRGCFLLAPALVQDLLEARPDTERNPHPAVGAGLVETRELGLPRWTTALVASDPPIARLSFELRFDPRVFDRIARTIEGEVAAALRAADSTLVELEAAGAVRLEIVAAPPRSLDPPGDKFE